jgi:hypothetical protein
VNEVDRYQAAAEMGLDRLDDVEFRPDPASELGGDNGAAPAQLAPDDYGIHVDDPDADLLSDDLDAGLRDDGEADALDALAERFNARDLDGLLELLSPDAEAPGLLGHDRANLPEAVEGLWRRRPSGCLTRGYVGTEHVGILWEHDGTNWWRVAVVHVDDVAEAGIGVLEFSDDAALIERVVCDGPDDDDLEEGARWVEWDEGADGDG